MHFLSLYWCVGSIFTFLPYGRIFFPDKSCCIPGKQCFHLQKDFFFFFWGIVNLCKILSRTAEVVLSNFVDQIEAKIEISSVPCEHYIQWYSKLNAVEQYDFWTALLTTVQKGKERGLICWDPLWFQRSMSTLSLFTPITSPGCVCAARAAL